MSRRSKRNKGVKSRRRPSKNAVAPIGFPRTVAVVGFYAIAGAFFLTLILSFAGMVTSNG